MKIFGELNPVIKEKDITKTFSLIDHKTFILSQRVSKDWYKIINGDNLSTKRAVAYATLEVSKYLKFFPWPIQQIINESAISKLDGYTNQTYKIVTYKNIYILRLPGNNTIVYINRSHEYYNSMIVSKLGLGAEIIFFDKETGLQFINYIVNQGFFTLKNANYMDMISQIVLTLKKLHNSKELFINNVDVFKRNADICSILYKSNQIFKYKYDDILSKIIDIGNKMKSFNVTYCPCHNDSNPENFLVTSNGIQLIDWEYSGNNDPLWDLTFLSMQGEFTEVDNINLLTKYYGSIDDQIYDRFILYMPVVEFWSSLWADLQIVLKNTRINIDELRKAGMARLDNCKKILESSMFNTSYNKICMPDKSRYPKL